MAAVASLQRRRARVLLAAWLLILSSLVASTCRGDDEPCAVTCATADAWCRSTFGRGGRVSATACDAQGVTCTCNNASSIRVAVVTASSSSSSSSSSSTSSSPSDEEAATQPQQQRCVWSGVFDDVLPNSRVCGPLTGVCPQRCADITAPICDTATSSCIDIVATPTTPGGFAYNCSMCNGRVYRIVGDAQRCRKSFDDDALCNAAGVCGGHGCCNTAADRGTRPCRCYDDAAHGHYAGATCQECTADYTRDPASGRCVVARPRIEVILTSIAKTWTMVLPNLAVVFLFVVCGLARRPWESDTTFDATTLRRARLSAIHLERRRRRAAAAAAQRARPPQRRRRWHLVGGHAAAGTAAAAAPPPTSHADVTTLWF